MKKFMVLSIALLLFTSCSKENKTENEKESTSIKDVFGSVKTMNTLSNSMEDIQKNTERLQKLTPVSNDELKAVLPETLLGLPRVSLSVGDNSMMKISSAEAEYKDENNKEIKVKVLDGAGETGSAMISLLMMGFTANSEKTTQDGFEKMGDFNGTKAQIKETKRESGVDSEINYILKDRYMITIEADGYTTEELKKVMDIITGSSLK